MKNSEKSKEQLMKEIDQLLAKIDDLKKFGSERKLDKDVQTTEKEFSKILLDNANAFILTLDVNANITLFNKFAEKLTDYKKDEVLGKNWFDFFISKRNGSVITEVFQDVLKEMPDVSSYENPILCKDGSERVINWKNTVLKNENGETSGVLSIGIEITERKQAEEKVKEHIKNTELLSKTAMLFVDFPQDKNIYSFIGEQLQEFTGKDSYIIVNSIDNEANILTTRAIIGIDKFSEYIINLLGKDPVGKVLHIKDSRLVYLHDGKLYFNVKDLYGITFGSVPKNICKSIEKVARIGDIYTAGIVKGEKLLGTIIILMKKESPKLTNLGFLETYIKQAAIAIQKRQAEQALKESEAHYRLLFNTLPYSAEILDFKGNILDCNPSTLEMFGYKRNEIVGRNITEFADVETVEFFNKNFSQAIKSKILNNEACVIHKNGNIVHIIRTINPILSADGVVKNLLALNVDITKRKKAEEALKNSEKRLNILFESAPDAYYLNDFTGKFIDGNKAAEKLLGYPREELIGKNFVEVVLYPIQAKKALDVLARNINGESTGPHEYTLKRKDGSKVEVEILTHPVIINNEGMVLGLARDISERKQTENQLKSKMKQLIMINNITINRELTLNETRKEVNELLRKLGKEEKYKTIG